MEDQTRFLKATAYAYKNCASGCDIFPGNIYYIKLSYDDYHRLLCTKCFGELDVLLNMAGIRTGDLMTEHLKVVE